MSGRLFSLFDWVLSLKPMSMAWRQPSVAPTANSCIYPLHQDPPAPELDDHAVIDFVNPSGPLVSFACGHEDHRYFELNRFGETLTLSEDKQPSKCRACFREQYKQVIRCCHCGGAIYPDNAITLYDAPKEDRTWTVSYVVSDGNRRYVGCLGDNCTGCYSASVFDGTLTAEGVHIRFRPGTSASSNMGTSKNVVL
jgi:hypothetical protein